ncbi:MAG: OsmC family protein [Promethearchaeota archaeon]
MGDETPKTIEFDVTVTWTGGKEGTISLVGKTELPISAPVYWDGKPDVYSPQDLFVSAVTGCYITTFASMMKRMKQPLIAHQALGRAVLRQHPEGGWYFSDIYVTMNITIPKEANLQQVQRAVTLTEKYCHVSRSVASKMHVESKIRQLD